MSKAFTKEGDEPEVALEPRPLPAGVANYMTRAGYERLRAEVLRRPGDPRAAALGRRLDAAVVVDPAPSTTVAFGATVEVEQDGRRRTYALVGVDEVDERPSGERSPEARVSWLSPIGRALIGARAGDVVTVETPGGELELEVLAIG